VLSSCMRGLLGRNCNCMAHLLLHTHKPVSDQPPPSGDDSRGSEDGSSGRGRGRGHGHGRRGRRGGKSCAWKRPRSATMIKSKIKIEREGESKPS